jgi:DNA invertase Pin-like site-specific DNA recombinase
VTPDPARTAGPPAEAGGLLPLRPEKVQAWHRERLAVVYVRQSTGQQVLDHRESTRLQYGLTAQARALGWAADRVLVVDDDLGKSGATAAGRAGFQRLVAEVGLDHVGLVLGAEMSRLARSSADWHRLLELCARFGTLLADVDGVYDPAEYNDRLLLGLKGTMSEAELHWLRLRLHQGRLNKARRGELAVALPIGYVRRPSGEVGLDPDEQVQHVVRLVFRAFARLGTLNGLLQHLVRHGVRLGVRVREGPGRGELEWRPPTRTTLHHLLTNPAYAGAYAYGRRRVDPRRARPGRPRTGRTTPAPEDWAVLLPDRLPAYIPWAQYERNLARLRANRARADAVGAPRRGPALLAGLVVCARCGQRMLVRYGRRGDDGWRATYVCTRLHSDYGAPECQHLAGAPLERVVSQQVLAALEPAALELSLAAAETLQRERDDLLRLWQQRRERAAYEAERAGRQFRLAEPEHRLVARQLEHEWEAKLAAQERLEEDFARFRQAQPRLLSAAERDAIRRLAADVPALWGAPTTTAAERKEIVRQLVERVVVAVDGTSERVRLTLHWVGGLQTAGELVRPVARLAQLSAYPQLCARVRALAAAGLRAAAIAESLNAEGFRPPKRRERFGPQGVLALMQRLGLDAPRSRSRSRAGLGPDEWWLPALAQELGMPRVTLYHWARRGGVRARRQVVPPAGPASRPRLILWADAAEVDRLRQRRQRPAGAAARQRWLGPPAPGTGGRPPGAGDESI